MLSQSVLFLMNLVVFTSCNSLEYENATELGPDEAAETAQSFLEAGLEGISINRITHRDQDIDSCHLIRTSIYEVQLLTSGETFEITTVTNTTNRQNCWNKDKLVALIAARKLNRVLKSRKDVFLKVANLEIIPVEDFLTNFSNMKQEDFYLFSATYSYKFDESNEPDQDFELIAFNIKMIDSGDEYLINTETVVGFDSSVDVKTRKTPYPPKVLLSLLGGGSYTNMRRLN
ncbi:uncharacterized protein LOC129750903 [Uranotaenia lowii]|uniref:uncharacterized protein LOC129750903 n=1 Tax=Uranotaenia lowii TaxID=190385 RepID=UPI002478800D|nr:uncharacterized protein LOC129750903 [Uranotaenia lowii]